LNRVHKQSPNSFSIHSLPNNPFFQNYTIKQLTARQIKALAKGGIIKAKSGKNSDDIVLSLKNGDPVPVFFKGENDVYLGEVIDNYEAYRKTLNNKQY
jgi:hypothetical protein